MIEDLINSQDSRQHLILVRANINMIVLKNKPTEIRQLPDSIIIFPDRMSTEVDIHFRSKTFI